ncbi:MAG TPA: hypothetical protein VFD15_00940 [Clostridia bacterium]|nr:hypothetical protein [Clostridia bacterium]
MIFPIGLALLAVVVILIVYAVKNQTEQGGTDVIKNVYVYLVLFATLMMTIGGSVGAFMAAADIIAPVSYHQSFEDFKRFSIDKPDLERNNGDQSKLTDEELKQQYDAMVHMEMERQKDRAYNSLVKSFGWIIIPLPVFIYFQRRLLKT